MVLEAAKRSDTDTVEFLITKPPGLQITDAIIREFITFRAMERFCKEVLQVFCDNAKDFKPTEDIAIAAARSSLGREFLGYLIARYGSVPITESVWKAATCNYDGNTIEFFLDQNFKPQDTESITASVAVLGLVQVVERLSQAWKEIDSEKWLGVANLCNALQAGDVKKVQELISKGVWPGAKHQGLGWTPLSIAAKSGNEKNAQILLRTGKVELETQDEEGKTPLCSAAELGHKDVVKILLEAGANSKAAGNYLDIY